MSKQSEAKRAQGYASKAHTCADCKHLQSDIELPQWMNEQNSKTPGQWDVKTNGSEKNVRCGIGGFAIKKNGICNKHEATTP